MCALEGCEKTFLWRSSFSRQICCCPSHSEKRKYLLDNPLPQWAMDGSLHCRKCATTKPRSEFPQSTGTNYRVRYAQCTACNSQYSREWREAHKDSISAATRRSRVKKTLAKYGAPADSYDALLEAQGGGCGICGGGNGEKQYHIDHDHNKPEHESYRGILCHWCNLGLGHFKDDPELLQSAVNYLEGSL